MMIITLIIAAGIGAAYLILRRKTPPPPPPPKEIDPRNKIVPILPVFGEYSEKRKKFRAPITKKAEERWKAAAEESRALREQEINDYGRKVIRCKQLFCREIEKQFPELKYAYLVDSGDPQNLVIPSTVDEIAFRQLPRYTEFVRAPLQKVRVRNNCRLQAIRDIMEKAGFGIFGDLDTFLQEPHDIARLAPYNPDDLLRCQGNIPDLYYRKLYPHLKKTQAPLRDLINARLYYYASEYKIALSGEMGEKRVLEQLEAHSDAFFFIPNLRLEFPGNGKRNSVETDFLVLSPIGAAALEVKNYGSTGKLKILAQPDGRWQKRYRAMGPEGPRTVTEPMDDPFAQNDWHISHLEREVNRILGRSMDDRIYLDNIVVIANDNVEIEAVLPPHQHLTRVGGLYGLLTANRSKVMTAEEAGRVCAQLRARSLSGLDYPINDFSEEMASTLDVWLGFQKLSQDFLAAAESLCRQYPELLEI